MNKEKLAQEIKKMLEALKDKIPEIITIEAGIDFNGSVAAADVVLYSEFESKEALSSYQAHPDHQAVIPFIKEAVTERMVVDYQTK